MVNHRMSDANTLSQCKSYMRSVKHLHPLLAQNSDRQLVLEANFVSVIQRFILVSSGKFLGGTFWRTRVPQRH